MKIRLPLRFEPATKRLGVSLTTQPRKINSQQKLATTNKAENRSFANNNATVKIPNKRPLLRSFAS